MEKNSFVFYKDWRDAIKDLPDSVRLELYDCIVRYAFGEQIGGLKPMASIAFKFIKPILDRDREKYATAAEKNKNNGSKGGRPKRNKNEKTQKPNGFSENPKKHDNDNVNDNDNENVNDNENENESESVKGQCAAPCSNGETHSHPYRVFIEWLKTEAPYCYGNMKLPDENELQLLRSKFDTSQLESIIGQIENRKDLRQRYTNLFRTILNWADKEYAN